MILSHLLKGVIVPDFKLGHKLLLGSVDALHHLRRFALGHLEVTESSSVNFLELFHLLKHGEFFLVDNVMVILIVTLQHIVVAHANHVSLDVVLPFISLFVEFGLELVDLALGIVALLSHVPDVSLELFQLISIVDDRVLELSASFHSLELDESILLVDMRSELWLILRPSGIQQSLLVVQWSTDDAFRVLLEGLGLSDLGLLFFSQFNLMNWFAVSRSDTESKLTLLLDFADASFVSHRGFEGVFFGSGGTLGG